LSVDQLLGVAVAVAGIIALRAAGIVLVELLIGIVDATGDAGEPDLVFPAGDGNRCAAPR